VLWCFRQSQKVRILRGAPLRPPRVSLAVRRLGHLDQPTPELVLSAVRPPDVPVDSSR
jgi:hypothetical protein